MTLGGGKIQTKDAYARVSKEREERIAIEKAAAALAEALEQMPLGIIGWPQDVSKRTLEMRDAALAQYKALVKDK